MFLNPLMLAGVCAALLPVVLHVLARARVRSVDWGAMMFLDGAGGARRDGGTRLREAALLATRCAIIAALAVALARPVARRGWSILAEPTHVTAVILLDRSASMGFEDNGRQRLDDAKRAALNILATLQRGDEASVVTLGDDEADESTTAVREPVDRYRAGGSDETAEPAPTTDLQSLAARIDAITIATGRADVEDGLIRARRLLRPRRAGNRRELYVITDRQAVSWENVNAAAAQAWRRAFASVEQDAPPRVFLIPIGGEESENLAVESIDLPGPPPVRDQPAVVDVRVRNYGAQARAGVGVTVLSGAGRELGAATVNLPTFGSQTARVSVTFAATGSHVVAARVTGAGMRGDDRAEAALDVVAPPRVMVVAPDDASPAGFLRAALMPFAASGTKGLDPISCTAVPLSEFSQASKADIDVVLLDGVPRLSGGQVRELEQFVYAGGGLIVAPGPMSDTADFAAALFKDDTGLLPARLGPLQPVGDNAGAVTKLATLDGTHPVLSFLAGHPDLLKAAEFARLAPVSPVPSYAHTIAAFADRRPFIVERIYGRGRVVLLTASLDGEGNTLPMTALYLPLAQSLVRYCAAGDIARRANLEPGEPIETTFAGSLDGATAQVVSPTGQVREVPLSRASAGDRYGARFTATQRPGRYVVRARAAAAAAAAANAADGTPADVRARGAPGGTGAELLQHFVVRLPRRDSDLTPLTAERRQFLRESLNARELPPEKQPMTATIAAARTGAEMHLPFLALVVAMIGLESWLAGRWSSV